MRSCEERNLLSWQLSAVEGSVALLCQEVAVTPICWLQRWTLTRASDQLRHLGLIVRVDFWLLRPKKRVPGLGRVCCFDSTSTFQSEPWAHNKVGQSASTQYGREKGAPATGAPCVCLPISLSSNDSHSFVRLGIYLFHSVQCTPA